MSDVPCPTINLHGVPLSAITEAQCNDRVMAALERNRGGWVVTHNLDHIRLIEANAAFASACAQADLRVADGMPLIWASRLQGCPLPERVAGSSLISTLSAAAAEHGRSIFLMGGDEGTAEEAARVLISRNPSLRIAGTLCPPMGFDRDAEQMNAIEQKLIEAAPDIVYVALGTPKQELLIGRMRHVLPHAWWVGVGISFSLLAGRVRRAPAWARSSGLEWAHRLVQEPRKLARRHLVDGIPFALRLMARSIADRGTINESNATYADAGPTYR